jgi:hypothetical protein
MRVWLAGASATATLLASLGSNARVEAQSGYTKTQTYSAALRYLRVDLGYEVIEKDAKAAYLIFRYAPPGRRKTTNGSIEIIDTRDQVKILVQLPEMPRYHETVLRDGLVSKLRREYGEPPRSRRDRPDKKAGKKRNREETPDEKPPAERQPDTAGE